MLSILKIFFSDVFSKAMLAALGIALIRFMPQDEYAIFTFALAVIALTTQVISGSFNRIYIVGWKQLGLGQSIAPILFLQLTGGCGIVLLGLPWMGQFHGVYWYVAFLIVASSLFEFSKTSAQKELRFSLFSTIEVVRAVITAAGLVALLFIFKFDTKAWQVLGVQGLAMLIVFLMFTGARLNLSEFFKTGEAFRIGSRLAKGEYRFLFVYFLILAVFGQIDVFMLRLLSDDMQLATYGAAFRYYSILALGLSAVHAVLLPLIQQVKAFDELRAIFDKHRRMALLFVPLVVVVGWGSQWLIPWVDLGKYPTSVAVFRILCVSVVISFAFSPHVNLVMRFEKFRFLSWLILVALFVNVILNLVLIKVFGAVGVAIATLVASAAVTVPIFVMSRRLTFGICQGEMPVN